MGELTKAQITRAAKEWDADLRQRLLMFDGGPELMSWSQTHRHHKDEPYIGCLLCRDQFVRRADLERLQDALAKIESYGEDYKHRTEHLHSVALIAREALSLTTE